VSAQAAAPLLLRIDEAAQALALSTRQVYRLIDRGELVAVHSGRAVRIPADTLTRYVDELKEAAS
jgi:excisionase family DNA binding protein